MAAPRLPIFDNHFHLDPRGRGLDAVREFARAGGTSLMLVHKPYREHERPNTTLEDFRRDFDTTIALHAKIRSEVPEVTAWVALAPHPAEFTELLKVGWSLDDAHALYMRALDLAATYVRDGKAVAMGEVGRPHWRPIEDAILAKANESMAHAFSLARDLGCAVQIHAETATPESFADLRAHVDAARLPVGKVVKHYSTPIVDTAVNHGIWPSVLIGKGAAEEAAKGGVRWMMETDYMDDALVFDNMTKRSMPIAESWRLVTAGAETEWRSRFKIIGSTGAVLGPKTVPKRTRDLLAKGLMTEEQAWTIHAENPKKVYGIEVDL